MKFEEIINAKRSLQSDRPLMQKDAIPVSDPLHEYLLKNGRSTPLPLAYSDLVYYSHSNVVRDQHGKLTHWETAIFEKADQQTLYPALLNTFALLHTGLEATAAELEIVQVDFCEFGNSVPFRIKVREQSSGKVQQFYIKIADASRIYGLELEQLLAPDPTNFLYDNNTLVEAHIPGMPGDVFLSEYLHQLPTATQTQIAAEFVSFNERCFARLLGDMRSYNFVIAQHPGPNELYFFQPIDFDQQSYEGRKNLYLPQFYKENHDYVELVLTALTPDQVVGLQLKERERLKMQLTGNVSRVVHLLDCMSKDELSEAYKVRLLRRELDEHFKTDAFAPCKSMGELVKCQLITLLGSDIFEQAHN
ncbi:MAG: hypothetical protein Q7T76_08990 [Ferruginibacter sp.]|nr:hypothetical protein [Ferruginibacter sp.]